MHNFWMDMVNSDIENSAPHMKEDPGLDGLEKGIWGKLTNPGNSGSGH
jgi:hypothetical protein